MTSARRERDDCAAAAGCGDGVGGDAIGRPRADGPPPLPPPPLCSETGCGGRGEGAELPVGVCACCWFF